MTARGAGRRSGKEETELLLFEWVWGTKAEELPCWWPTKFVGRCSPLPGYGEGSVLTWTLE